MTLRARHLLSVLLVVVAWSAPAEEPAVLEPPQAGLPRVHVFGDAAYDSGQLMELVTRPEDLPTHGEPLKRPWNAYWWPYKHGGLTRRWLSPEEPSPIEKMDVVTERGDQCKQWEIQQHPADVDWGGQCDGYAIASVLEPEPIYPVLHDGVCFSSGDVKGLLGAIYMGDMSGQRVDVLGRNAFDDVLVDADLDPATFHLALTNVMGLHGQGLYLDIGQDGQIYNKPIASYVSEAVPWGNTLQVETTLQVVTYQMLPEIQAAPEELHTRSMKLSYALELDDAGHILPGRGVWTGASAAKHPSSMKIPRGTPTRTPINNPFIDVELVKILAARSAFDSGPECWPEHAAR